jgi:hypothetical protein
MLFRNEIKLYIQVYVYEVHKCAWCAIYLLFVVFMSFIVIASHSGYTALNN